MVGANQQFSIDIVSLRETHKQHEQRRCPEGIHINRKRVNRAVPLPGGHPYQYPVMSRRGDPCGRPNPCGRLNLRHAPR
jgi:hypothetical protein